MSIPIADLHCDLLCYLHADKSRTAHDPSVRCSINQLRQGNVHFQTMAIFTETKPGSAAKGVSQARIFRDLPSCYPETFEIVLDLHTLPKDKINIFAAIENASSISEENEKLAEAFRRLIMFNAYCGKILYMSLTWNTENRFGGGAHTNIGLKDDGKRLLDFLHKRRMAVDLSHASDKLAYDILHHIDRHEIDIPVLASHSNCRSITNVQRNLPDDLIQEIMKRNGIIGLNMIREFVGRDNPNTLYEHMRHIQRLGGEKNLCLGADFFFGEDVSPENRKTPDQLFFPSMSNASVYPEVLELWQTQHLIDRKLLENVAHGNLIRFLETQIFNQSTNLNNTAFKK